MGGKQQKDYSKGSLQNQTRLRGFRRWKLLLLGQLVPNPSLQAELNCKDIPIRRLGPNYAKFLAPSIQTWLTRETSPFSLKNASFFVIAYLSRYGPHPWLCPPTHWTKVPTLQLEQWRWSISWHSSHPLHEESWCSQGDFDLLQDQSPCPSGIPMSMCFFVYKGIWLYFGSSKLGFRCDTLNTVARLFSLLLQTEGLPS